MSESGSTAGASFKVSSFSSGGSCVEVGQLADGSIAVRHSKLQADETIVFSEREWTAFIAGAKAGEFDSF